MSFSEKAFADQQENWWESRKFTPEKMALAHLALQDVIDGVDIFTAIRNHPLQSKGGGFVNKQFIIAAYRQQVLEGILDPDPTLLEKLRMKPMRTLSGVTTVTVLTKPYPCPGECIFCPTDVRMPKSYLPDEPGAMRALHHKFDPYTQVKTRIEALHAIGHPTSKIELLILGGTWSSYTRSYQEWFILRCFHAMNGVNPEGFPAPEHRTRISYREALLEQQTINETSTHRNVGLTIETRPDHVDADEAAWLRHLGVTKIQMGAQSFDDHILEINQRGHDVQSTLEACAMLRAAGFKIVLHWMPNLYGATPASDVADFAKTWVGFCPDELKIYPNQLLKNAELYDVWLSGQFQPYTTEELVDLLVAIKPTIPRYCRINRVVRDIPSNNVVEGNKRTSLRMDVHQALEEQGKRCQCIRCREVRGKQVIAGDLTFDDLVYPAAESEEHFLSYNTPADHLAGFLRLSLPIPDAPETGLTDLEGAAIIREVHVYGQSVRVGKEKTGAAQHSGLGTQLMLEAEQIARDKGFERLAVIAAIGTREYYLDRGFSRGDLYLVKNL